MSKREPIPLHDGIYLIDGMDMGLSGRTGTYVFTEEDLTIIETGPSPSFKYIKEGIETLGLSLQDLKYIIVTHIHLDHAGGAGLLLTQCPNAKVVVHPRGARHLVDPSRLVGGARAIYGDSFSDFFDPVVPVPEDKILIKDDGDSLQIGKDRTLTFFDTPGHSRHHLSIYDPVSNGLFTGDAAGILYEQLAEAKVDFYLPSTSPNHFDPKAMHKSLQRFREMNLDRMYFGHFGMTENPDQAVDQVGMWLDIFIEEAEKTLAANQGYDVLADRLLKRVQMVLRAEGIEDNHKVYTILNLDLQVSALGMIDYFQKRKN